MPLTVELDPLPVAEARAGDPVAWDRLFKRYQLPLYAYLVELIRDQQTALDLVQDTFVNAARYIGRLENDAKFGSWLFSIAHQKSVQHWRRHRSHELLSDTMLESLPGDEEDPGDSLIRKEQEQGFWRALDALSTPHRSVLLLHFIEEFPLDEIARITELPVGTVKSRLHYAKRALRECLEDC